MWIVSLFTHSYFIPNTYDFPSSAHKKIYILKNNGTYNTSFKMALYGLKKSKKQFLLFHRRKRVHLEQHGGKRIFIFGWTIPLATDLNPLPPNS